MSKPAKKKKSTRQTTQAAQPRSEKKTTTYAWDSLLLPEGLREAFRPLSSDADRTNLSPEERLKKTAAGRVLAVKAELDRMETEFQQEIRAHRAYNEGAKLVQEALGDDAERGAKVRSGGRKGHENAHGTQEAKEHRYKEYQLEIDRLTHQHPNFSRDRRAELARKKFRVSKKTIQRNTTIPKRRSL